MFLILTLAGAGYACSNANYGDFPTDDGTGDGCGTEWTGFMDGNCYTDSITVQGVFYENLGCFCDDSPWDIRGKRETPRVSNPAKFDIKYNLMQLFNGQIVRTQITDDNYRELIDTDRDILIQAGGLELLPNQWPYIENAAKALLEAGYGGHCIEIDWTNAAHSWMWGLPAALTIGTYDDFLKVGYTQPSANARGAGRMVAYFIKKLVQNGVSPSRITLSGLSLGGEMISYIGKSWNVIKETMNPNPGMIGKIIALDPAGPHFDYSQALRDDPSLQSKLQKIALWRTDAAFVQVLHTNGNKGGFGLGSNNIKLGLSRSVGHADFFPSYMIDSQRTNGAEFLPGSYQLNPNGNGTGFCWNQPVLGRFGCDHQAAKYYWISSMAGNCLQGFFVEKLSYSASTVKNFNREFLIGKILIGNFY